MACHASESWKAGLRQCTDGACDGNMQWKDDGVAMQAGDGNENKLRGRVWLWGHPKQSNVPAAAHGQLATGAPCQASTTPNLGSL